MNLRAKLKPMLIIKANTKSELIDMMIGLDVIPNYVNNDNAVNCFGSRFESSVYPISFSKFRSKRDGLKAHWVAYVYTVNKLTLKDLGLVIEQHPRYFTIRNKEEA